ncbi:uncharacterized protein LOC106773586 [Vigna radiata var. radiata]|uniref:Uncharacterized protein LOC106773586 n=1 Tax=Vigna radiata var. radiata TaxID=3916 RepID=A0A1S3VBY1_VIGRR|nr:uncharacterized protein LOC106773586 [Vigna radiata var. radiata]XP_022642039.1 uncharacterized protein LOC106773586 [Vigna radiata var. radiata]
MEQDGDTCTMPPFWAAEYRDRRRLRRSYSLLRTSTSLLVLFIVLALVFSLIVVPTVQSFASNIFKPRTVKNSWDFLNLVLVLFAIICGFLGRNTTPETLTPRSGRTFSNPSTQPPTWYQYDYSYGHTPRRSFNRLRSFSSYPDLRQPIAADERFRFYDDTYFLQHRHPRNDAEEEVKEIGIDNVVTASPQQGTQTVRRNVHRVHRVETWDKHETDDLDATVSQPPPAIRTQVVRRNVNRLHRSEVVEKHETNDSAVEEISLSPPSTPPPATRTHGVRRNAKRTFQEDTIEKFEIKNLDSQSSEPSPASHPLPRIRTKGVQRNAKPERNYSAVKSTPPPPPPPPSQPAEAKTGQVKKKRGTATIEFLTSLRGKKKKLRQRSIENFESILNSETLLPQPPAPPPPPPKVFQNLFSLKKGKHKTTHNVRVAITGESNKRESGSSSGLKNNVMMAGNESPLNPIPPPPPLPPFKLPGWKFRVQGDYVRVDSIGSSRSGSPDLDEVSVDTPTTRTHDETSQVNSPLAKHGEDSASVSAPSLFCPSPDVDTKAHNFIESFRAGLRMAKMNSMNERQGIGRSNLGTFTTP